MSKSANSMLNRVFRTDTDYCHYDDDTAFKLCNMYETKGTRSNHDCDNGTSQTRVSVSEVSQIFLQKHLGITLGRYKVTLCICWYKMSFTCIVTCIVV